MPLHEIMRVALLGAHERLSAQRAHQIGLVTDVVPLAELRDAAAWVANAIASAPPVAIQGTVRAIWAAQDLPRREALDLGKVLIRLGSDPKSLFEGPKAAASSREFARATL
jgi:enoyl-CoA hydratase/carnithine racemase